MGWPEYGFAVFVFILVAVLVALNHFLKRSRQSALEISKDKEKRLFQLYQNLEDMISSAEEECEQTLAQIRKEKAELEELIGKTQVSGNLASGAEPMEDAPTDQEQFRAPLSFAERVRKLKGDGLSEERIAQELSASRGEVSLILGMYKS
ncbi:MAG: hypothetical protein AAGU74_02615 [Bacillota bacterium]